MAIRSTEMGKIDFPPGPFMPLTRDFARVNLSHLPPPLESLNNVNAEFKTHVWIKREDCTGLAFGGNKSRQLEFWYCTISI